MDFVPFDATQEEIAERQVLRPGVPASMRPALTTWIVTTLANERGYTNPAVFHTIENNLDVSFGINPQFDGLINKAEAKGLMDPLAEQDLLRVADFRLFQLGSHNDYKASALGQVLREGRSKYEVVKREKSYRLAERVPEGVQVAAEHLMNDTGTAGQLLANAWTKVYDLEPDDSGAYAAAVKAVEAAALPALGVTSDVATVSHAVRAIEKKDSTWRLPFLREHSEYPSRDVLLGMLKSLYKGQRDRHGSDAYSDVTHEEAETAVLMAVTLVGLFCGGLVLERDMENYG